MGGYILAWYVGVLCGVLFSVLVVGLAERHERRLKQRVDVPIVVAHTEGEWPSRKKAT